MQDEINDVLRLIAHPLENARQLMKGENKFVIQSNLLHQFNTVLDIVENKPSDIIIYHTDRKALESFEKLLNNISKLVVTQRSIHSHNHFIDIRRFKKLRQLELIRVPVDKVKGLSVLKPQLEYFLCDHCSEVDIITKSGKLQWSELVTLKIKNCAVNIEEHFFVSMPWIQHLDLSFTNLRRLDALKCLDNLKFLNLSFNHLEVLPTLSSASCPQLQILLINHNYLQSLQGLQDLTSLRGLDLSWNWISDKRTLAPLIHLKSLQWINLCNTPLSFNKYYRYYLASAIGSTAASHQFVIDNKGLNSQEQRVMGSGLGIVRCGKGSYSPEDLHLYESLSSNLRHTSSVSTASKASVSSSTKSKTPSRKGNRMREVVIEDITESVADDPEKIIETEEVSKVEDLENRGCQLQESKEESVQIGTERQNVLNNLIHEAVFSQQFTQEEKKCEIEVENKIPIEPTVSNITLGILEVEIHDSRYNENKEDDSEIVENNAEDIVEEETEITEQIMPATDFLYNQENDDNANLNLIEQEISTNDEFIQAEVLQELASLKTVDANTESDNKNDSVSNFDQSEEINLSTESHQDDQDYFSATEDKDRSKTISSIDSADLDESRDSIAALESHQDIQETSELLAEETDIKNESVTSSETLENLSPNPVDTQEKEVTKMDVDLDSESESSGASDIIEEEMWHVQKVDKTDVQNILLVLLENEIKEKSPLSGRTLSSWTLDCVQSCVKTKNEPFTVELEFDSAKADKQRRTYIMEFSDAQVLIKRMYSILESRPLSAMNQSTFKCLKCDSIFVHSTPSSSKLKTAQIKCTICSSATVSLMEEPRPPEVRPLPDKPVSHSSSQSSIALDRGRDGNGSSSASSTSKISCSAASLEHAQKLVNTGMATPRKYESDIEIISNPSQSSIEVLDEYGRSQGSTPSRKRSSEERQFVAVPQLGTVMEVNAQLSALTESSSSGSLSESVITTYETHNLLNKKPKPEECLIEESREDSPETEPATNQTQETLSEENGNISEIKPTCSTDIYNYNDFTQVDVRIKLFFYQSIFNDENEELLLLVKCHLWKTGGADYDACVVFSTTKVYFLSHSITKFQEDTCDWLTLNDTILLKEIKKIYPIIWQQGAILNTNKITYLVLLLDKERTVNFFKFLEGLSLKELKIQNHVNTKNEMALQQAVLSSSVPHSSIDPSVSSFCICLKICVTKDDDVEIMRLAGLVVTGSEFHVVPGDLRWLCSTVAPTIHLTQQMASLIDVERTETSLTFHFLNEGEALEEIWSIKLETNEQVLLIIKSIMSAWEPLQ
ncbi:uncharacterized protein isoform X2 [Rhodnius prolixus]